MTKPSFVTIKVSTKPEKKLMAIFEDCNTGRQKITHFVNF
jgi:hypothetical protein